VRKIFGIILVLLTASVSHADFVTEQATFEFEDCVSPALASSPDGITMLAFVSTGGAIPMNFVHVQELSTQWTGLDFPAPPENLLLSPFGKLRSTGKLHHPEPQRRCPGY